MKLPPLKTLCFLTVIPLAAAANAAETGYRVINKIQLGGEGGWDALTVDSAARRLFWPNEHLFSMWVSIHSSHGQLYRCH